MNRETIKAQARLLRAYLASQGLELGHSKCLEAMAKVNGFRNWDTLGAVEEGERAMKRNHPKKNNGPPKVAPYAPSEVIVTVGSNPVGGFVDGDVQKRPKDTYTLDVRKWRCGGSGEHALGEGDTYLRNSRGYMCCLGQFAEQRGVDVGSNIFLDPSQVGVVYDRRFVTPELCDTDLTRDLEVANDKPKTTPAEKVAKIRELLAGSGAELVVIDPDNILGGA